MKLKGKKVFITGADGFIGSHLAERLLDLGCIVRALSCYNAFNSWGWLDAIPKEKLKEIEVIPGDVRDPHGMRSCIEGMDIVFHLAALIGIPYSYHSPDAYVDTNVKGTLNILQACRTWEVERVLVTSTSEVYGTARYVPIDEHHPRQGQSPYSATKIGADSLSDSFYRAFGLPVTVVRPFNTYGPRQSARAIIPTVITQLLAGSNDIRLGAMHPTRDLLFVKDTVSGFIEIARSDGCVGEEINIASESEISMGDLAAKLIGMINPEASIALDERRLRPEKSEVERLFGSCKKIMTLTDWRPEYDLDRGLKETVEWFGQGSHLNKYKWGIYNV